MNKYKARRTKLDGITFDSKGEANRYAELKLLERAGEISKLKLQPCFVLLEDYVRKDGIKIRGIMYYADFSYMENGEFVVEDFKGNPTPEFKLKKKFFEAQNPNIILRITK